MAIGIRIRAPKTNVSESRMNAASVPHSETTIPPNIAPMHNEADQDAEVIAFAVSKSSSSTTLGKAALSAVT